MAKKRTQGWWGLPAFAGFDFVGSWHFPHAFINATSLVQSHLVMEREFAVTGRPPPSKLVVPFWVRLVLKNSICNISAKWRDQKMSDFCSPEAGTSPVCHHRSVAACACVQTKPRLPSSSRSTTNNSSSFQRPRDIESLKTSNYSLAAWSTLAVSMP